MFIALLTFGPNKQQAQKWMEGHKEWIASGFENGMFQLIGSIKPAAGGALIARADSYEELEAFVNLDPFVEHGIVEVAIHEIAPSRAAPEWEFLLEQAV